MNIYAKLLEIQNELKAPKGQKNSFGNYNYRSCEDILEAVKPLCYKHRLVLTITDAINVESNRFYVTATARLVNTEKPDEIITNTASAREEETKKGMDGSQITGACSSYARKYALNGLFCIDDTKDADTDAYKKQENKAKQTTISDEEYDRLFDEQNDLVTDKEIQMLRKLLTTPTVEGTKKNINGILTKYNKFKLEELLMTEYVEIIHYVEELKKKQKESMKGVM